MILKYLKITKGLSYIEDGKSFILYRMKNDVLEIHDVYSEEGVIKILNMNKKLISKYKPSELEGYVDQDYVNKDRSHKLMLADGFKVIKENEEYIYYRKKVDYGRE